MSVSYSHSHATVIFQVYSFQLLPAEQNSFEASHLSAPSEASTKRLIPQPSAHHTSERRRNKNKTQNSQHAPIPPKPLRGNVQAAADGAAFIVRPSHVDDQHRGDFHREDHLRALLGHDSCFEAGRWEGGVPWLLLLALLGLLGWLGGCHCGWI